MKRLRLLLVLAFLGLSMGLVTAQSWTGSGTEASPYKITSASDLQALATYVNAGNTCAGMYFEMTTDIDLSGVCGAGIGSWTPIGIYKYPYPSFNGIFDGGNKKVKGLYIKTEEMYPFGLFGFVENATIKNLALEGATVSQLMAGATSYNTYGDKYGGICGRAVSSQFSYCSIGLDEDCYLGGNYNAAGICGSARNSDFSHCVVGERLHVVCAGDRSLNFAGICYDMEFDEDGHSISYCTNNADVYLGEPADNKTGAAAGILFEGNNPSYNGASFTISHCINNGNLAGQGAFGICGSPLNWTINEVYEDNTIVEYCANTGSLQGIAAAGICWVASGKVRYCYNTGSIEGRASVLFHTAGIVGCLIKPNPLCNGSIECCYNLGTVVGTGDIGTGVIYLCVTGGIVGSVSQDLSVRNCYNAGWVHGVGVVGGIAGVVDKEVALEKCYNIAQLTCEAVTFSDDGKALENLALGLNNGKALPRLSSWVASPAKGETYLDYAGGLVGYAEKVGSTCFSCSDCYYDRQMCTLPYAYYTAAEFGQQGEGNIGHALATLNLVNMAGFGIEWEKETGLYPQLAYFADNADSYTRSASIVSATPAYLVGGETVDRVMSDFTVNTSNGVQWSKVGGDDALNLTGVPNVIVVGIGADTLAVSLNGASKYIRMEAMLPCWEGKGTEAQPYLITNGADLKCLADCVNLGEPFEGKYFKVTADIDLLADGICGEGIGNWEPIGHMKNDYVYDNDCCFSGNFDGNGKTISNLYINASGSDFQALFGLVGALHNDVKIEGIRLSNAHIIGRYGIGGIIAMIHPDYAKESVLVENCSVDENSIITAELIAGGIVADCLIAPLSVRNCVNAAAVSSIGSMPSIDILSMNCAGGIVGSFLSTGGIEGCKNTGTVIASLYAGGISGWGMTGIDIDGFTVLGNPISNCANTGEVIGLGVTLEGMKISAAGGICGALWGGVVNCYNLGDVSAHLLASGLVGSTVGDSGTYLSLIGCYNAGTVCAAMAAGLVGYANIGKGSGEFSYCYNVGQLQSNGMESPLDVAVVGLYGNVYVTTGSFSSTECYYDNQMCPSPYAYYMSEDGDLVGVGGNSLSTLAMIAKGNASGWNERYTYNEHLYPQLNVFAGTTASIVSTTPVLLSDGQNVEGVFSDFSVVTDNSVQWSHSGDGSVLDISGVPSVIVAGTGVDTLTVSKVDSETGITYSRDIVIKAIPDPTYWVESVMSLPAGYSVNGSEIEINTPEGLAWLASVVNGYNGQTANTLEGYTVNVTDNLDMGDLFWMPIGTVEHPFSGTFNVAEGMVISGIILDEPADYEGIYGSGAAYDYQGLFGCAAGATFSNVTLKESTIIGKDYVAGICARAANSNFMNCRNENDVTAAGRKAGGICAQFEAEDSEYTVLSCYNTGNVLGYMSAGGIVGQMFGGTVMLSFNMGDVEARLYEGKDDSFRDGYDELDMILAMFGSAGGVVGANAGFVAGCYNTGRINGVGVAGGVVGSFLDGNVNICYNVNSVNCTSSVLDLGGKGSALAKYGFRANGKDGASMTLQQAGGIFGLYFNSSADDVEECYYDRQMCTRPYSGYTVGGGEMPEFYGVGGAAKSTEELMTINSWSEWGMFEGEYLVFSSNHYPELVAFAGAPASLVSVTPALLANGQTVDGVLDDFTVVTDNVVWSHESGDEVLGINGSNVSVNGLGTETITVGSEGYVKHITMTTVEDLPCWAGKGTENDPYQIADAAGLVCLANNVNAGESYVGTSFVMVSNIDLSSVCGESLGNWIPIGSDQTHPFDGVFDGGGLEVSNLYINETDETKMSALFGCVGYNNHGEIRNLTVSGEVTGGEVVAGIVSHVWNCTLSKCINKVNVKGSFLSGDDAFNAHVAGVCAAAYGDLEMIDCVNMGDIDGEEAAGLVSIADGGSLTRCYNLGTVKGDIYSAGIIANAWSVNITECFNMGEVTYDVKEEYPFAYAAGIVSCALDVDMSYCYNVGRVHGVGMSGGLVAKMEEAFDTNRMQYCYNAGYVQCEPSTKMYDGNSVTDVPSYAYSGALAAICNNGAEISNCVSDKQMCPTESLVALNSGSLTDCYAKLTLEMTDWEIIDLIGGSDKWITNYRSYPMLQEIYYNTGRMGEEASMVSTLPMFLYGNENVDKVQTSPFEVNNRYEEAEWMYLDGDDLVTFNGEQVSWEEQGTETVGVRMKEGYGFTKKITFTTNAELPGEYWVEVVTTCPDSYVQDDENKQIYLYCEEDFAWLASVVNGYNGQTADPLNGYSVYLNCAPNMKAHLWMPIGTDEHPFSGDFYGDGNVVSGILLGTPEDYTGIYGSGADYDYQGLFGVASGATISRVTLTNSTIEGSDQLGAICGSATDSSIIEYCYNKCNVTGRNYATSVGGIVGNLSESTVSNCYNTGTVTGSDFTGGVVGCLQSDCQLTNSFNLGAVVATPIDPEGSAMVGTVGGVVGYSWGTVANCYNAGWVNGIGLAGGIIGIMEEGSVSYCYNIAPVFCEEFDNDGMLWHLAGGLFGACNPDDITVTDCYYDKQMCTQPYKYYSFDDLEVGAVGNTMLTADMTQGWNPNELAFSTTWNCYPAISSLQWEDASYASIAPAFLVKEETVDGVQNDFTIGGNANWGHADGDNVLKYKWNGIELMGSGTETIAVSYGEAVKYIRMTTDYHPVLTWVDVVTSEPAGFDPNDIDSPEDLAWFISYVNGFNGCDAHPTAGGRITADIDMSEHWWVPIGFYCENVTGGSHDFHVDYTGCFNGNHYNIDGIRIDWNVLANSPVLRAIGNHSGKGNRDTYDYLGMFGSIENAIIEDVVLASGSIVGAIDNHSGAMGGIAGQMKGGKIRACVSNVSLTRLVADPMGGIVGECSGVYEEGGKEKPEGELKPAIIQNCMSTAELIGCGSMGGIVGSGEGIIISNCYGNAKFTVDASAGEKGGASYEAFVGGIVGGAYLPEIQNCYVRLRPDSYYGLDMKDGGGSEHFFGMIAGVTAEETIQHCYVPEGTEYDYVGYAENEVLVYAKTSSLLGDKGDDPKVRLGVRKSSSNTYYIMAPKDDPAVAIEKTTEQIEYEGQDYEIFYPQDVDERVYLYQNWETGEYYFCSNQSGNLNINAGQLVYGETPTYWNITKNDNGTYRISAVDVPTLCIGFDGEKFGAFTDGTEDCDFDIYAFLSMEMPMDATLYGCGTFTEAIANYTYTDPLGGNIITLDDAAEDDFATSGETTLLDALNNWVVYNFGDDTYNPQPDWARFGSALNGDYPVHCYYNPDNLTEGDAVKPTAKVITTPDKTNGFPFRYYSHVGDALNYYNNLENGGILCVYGSDDMSGAAVQSNDNDVDVYVNGMTYMKCPMNEDASKDWYVSLLQGSGSTLNVHSGFYLDNSDASGEVGGGAYDWHMVSSPLSGVPVGISYSDEAQHPYLTPASCTWNTSLDGLFPTDTPLGSYDFYAYSEPDYHWINLKQNSASHYHQDGGNEPIEYENDTELTAGHGYLIAMDKEVFMQVSGTLNNGTVTVPVTYSGAHNKGLNFLGNPYMSSLDFDVFAAENSGLWSSGTGFAQSYIILDADHKGYVTYATSQSENPENASRYIWPNQGFYIAAEAEGTAMFTNDMRVIKTDAASYFRGETVNYPLVNLKATGSDGRREMVTVEMGRPEQGGARKVKDMENGHGVMYASVEGKEYSVLFSTEGTNSVPVWFETREDDTYTMTWSAYNGTFQYLHLVDNMTGADVDMLTNTEYRFVSKTTDYQSRFRLQFAYTGVEEEQGQTDSQFVFQSGGNLVVTGEGEVEVVDVNGRVLSHVRTTGVQTLVSMPETAEGLYLVRLLGNDGVKVNKIVVRR